MYFIIALICTLTSAYGLRGPRHFFMSPTGTGIGSHRRLCSMMSKSDADRSNIGTKKLKVSVYSCKPYDAKYLSIANEKYGHKLEFHPEVLNAKTAAFAQGSEVICSFVNDVLDSACLEVLYNGGTRFLALRCAGFDSVELDKAAEKGILVARVPSYSPYAVAEHTLALILAVNRNTHRAYNRVRDNNFSLDGLIGFDLHGKTVGIIGTGKIGSITGSILQGFGCRILAYDKFPDAACKAKGFEYVSLSELLAQSDIVSLHAPLNADTLHIIDATAIAQMKHGIVLVNTSRGGLVDTDAVIAGLKSGKIARLALDVYEKERPLFFEDHSDTIITDDTFQRLQAFNNVIITGHQAFFTVEALTNIAESTLFNIECFASGAECPNLVTPVNKGVYKPIRI